ncbi:MAG: hypothetical protein R6U57_07735 [Anaerolineales bacterium]
MKSWIKSFPLHGWIGIGLIAVFWPLNWLGLGARTHLGFFPLWLGYCLTLDGAVYVRKGSSLLTRDGRKYIALFLLSIPMWWVFEALNLRLQNWHYIGKDQISDLEYAILASLSFSTVIPAVLESAELVGSFSFLKGLKRGPRFEPGPRGEIAVFIGGWVGLILLLIWPRYFFPLVWLSIYFILEPLNRWLGHRSLFFWTKNGDWRPLGALWVGVLITGFFWEMWNYYSYPKWVYSVPFVDVLHIFEMPLLGYGGYLPFSLEILTITQLAFNLFGLAPDDYLQLVEKEGDPSSVPSTYSGSENLL